MHWLACMLKSTISNLYGTCRLAYMKIKHYCLIALMLPTLLAAQVRSPDISEKYSYAVVDTPTVTIWHDYPEKKGNSYQGDIVNEKGVKYIRVVRSEGAKIVLELYGCE